MCEWPTGCTKRAKVTTRADSHFKQREKKSSFLMTASHFQLETTPLHSDAQGDGTHHSRLSLGHLFTEIVKAYLCLGCWFPLTKDTPLG